MKEINFGTRKELYDVAMNIHRFQPWEFLYDVDLIAIQLPDRDIPVYCSIMGQAGECFGICVYYDTYGVNGFEKICQISGAVPNSQLTRYQQCLACYWGNRDELSKKDRDILKNIGLTCRGKNSWLYFRSYEYKYYPIELNDNEVLFLTEVFQNLFMVLRAIVENGIKADFDEGEIIYRHYEQNRQEWLTYSGPRILPEHHYLHPKMKDEILLYRLKKSKKVKLDLELDISYTHIPMKDKKYSKPFILRNLLLADNADGEIIFCDLIEPDFDEVRGVLGIVTEFIQQNGRPETIIVRDEYFEDILNDLCKNLNINLNISETLPVIDEFMEGFEAMAHNI